MDNMSAGLDQASVGMNLPLFETRKALIIINMQNDSFYIKDDLYITKNHDIVPRLKEMIPYFRKHGDVVWVNTHMAVVVPAPSPNAANLEEKAERLAESNREAQREKEQQMRSEEAEGRAKVDSTAPNPRPENDQPTYYPSSKAKDIMTRASTGTRAEKRSVDSQAFDDKDKIIQTQLSKPRKGQQARFYIAGTKGAEICDGLIHAVDESLDLIVTKHHYSAFDQTSLLMALRQNLVTEVYLCGCLTNVSIYATAADAVQHGLQVTVIEDCLGYRNEDKHEEAMRQMADIMGVHGIDSEEIVEEAGGRPIPDTETPGIALDQLSLDSSRVPKIANPRMQQDRIAEPPGITVTGSEPTPGSDIGLVPAVTPSSAVGRRHRTDKNVPQDEPAQSRSSGPAATRNKSHRNVTKPQSLGPNDIIGSGDSKIIHNVLGPPFVNMAFNRVREEVGWQTMFHRSGQVPRLVAVQGEVGASGDIPIYRHPADESPPLLPFTPTIQRIRKEIESVLSQSFNHALIQLYRDGVDNISEHSDKTLDIVRGSVIVNVSIGAERVMTLRTKRSKHTQGSDISDSRQSQRIRMPHNSVFVLGPQTNREWLHGVRADKRPSHEKAEEEKAFGGERISITFRQIGTFINKSGDRIWGAGAKAKAKAEANKISTTEIAQMEAMINAFGKENHNDKFDWDAEYGPGFDVVNLINEQAKLTLCNDRVANIRVQLALCEKAISFTATEHEAPQQPEHEELKTRFHTWMHGLSNSDNPVFQDVDEKASKTEGDLGIMFYLETTYPFPDSDRSPTTKSGRPSGSARMFTQMGQSNELLFLWRELRDSQQGVSVSTPTNRFRLERPVTPNNKLHEEFHSGLRRWEAYAEASEYIAGDSWTIIDCTFWPVLNHLVDTSEELDEKRYPHLVAYYRKVMARDCVKAILARQS